MPTHLSNKEIFLGYKQGVKGYIFYALQSREISVTRNATFFELIFPYPKDSQPTDPGPAMQL